METNSEVWADYSTDTICGRGENKRKETWQQPCKTLVQLLWVILLSLLLLLLLARLLLLLSGKSLLCLPPSTSDVLSLRGRSGSSFRGHAMVLWGRQIKRHTSSLDLKMEYSNCAMKPSRLSTFLSLISTTQPPAFTEKLLQQAS